MKNDRVILFYFRWNPLCFARSDDKSSAASAVDEWTGRRHGRQIAVPAGHQARDSVLRLAEGHAGPSVAGPVSVVLRRFRHRLLDIVHHRVQAEIVDGRHLRRNARVTYTYLLLPTCSPYVPTCTRRVKSYDSWCSHVVAVTHDQLGDL